MLVALRCCGLLGLSGWRFVADLMGERWALEQMAITCMNAGLRRDSDAALAWVADNARSAILRRKPDQLFADRDLFRPVSSLSLSSFHLSSYQEGINAEISTAVVEWRALFQPAWRKSTINGV